MSNIPRVPRPRIVTESFAHGGETFWNASIVFEGVILWTSEARRSEAAAIDAAEDYIALVNRTSLRCVRRSPNNEL